MQCPRCQHDNPTHAKFCLECGAQFTHSHRLQGWLAWSGRLSSGARRSRKRFCLIWQGDELPRPAQGLLLYRRPGRSPGDAR